MSIMQYAGRIAAIILAGLSSAGCAMTVAESDEPLAQTEESLVSDPSGTIQVSIAQCAAGPKVGGIQERRCAVPPGFVLVGGGAEILGTPEALLVASFPDDGNRREWVVRAKDHVKSGPFQLVASAIGLRLAGVSETALRDMTWITSGTSGTPSHRAIQSTYNPSRSDRIVVGGGARPIAARGQHLLVQSIPMYDGSSYPEPVGWQAISKDHAGISELGVVTSYVITIPRCPPGFAGGCLRSAEWFDVTSSQYGYLETALTIQGAVTSVCAHSGYRDAGRLLTDMFAYQNLGGARVFASAKDHRIRDFGYVSVCGLVLGLR